jgi:hypothetical protein
MAQGPHPLKTSFALACLVLLVSCASMTPEECQRANWREVGQRDGQRGETLALMDKRSEDCDKVGVALDAQAYTLGRESGLRNYCRLENAVPLGLGGAGYAGVCPPEVEAIFVPRYQAAHAVFLLRSELRRLDERRDSLERRLRDMRRDEDQRLYNAASEQERERVRRDIDGERSRIRDELRDNDRRTQRRREDLRDAEFNLTQQR